MELEKLESSRLAEIEQLKTCNQEQLENLDKEKRNVEQSEEVNRELSVCLSTAESELEKLRTAIEELTEELHNSKSDKDDTSEALEIEKSRVTELDGERQRLCEVLQEQTKLLEESQTQNTKLSETNTQLSEELSVLKSAVESEKEKDDEMKKSKILELEQQHQREVSELRHDKDKLSEELAQNVSTCNELRVTLESERLKVNELQSQNTELNRSLEETRTCAAADGSRLAELQEAIVELEKLESSRLAEIEQLKTCNQEHLENLDKEKRNVSHSEELNSELTIRLSTTESELENSKSETNRLTEELCRYKSAQDTASEALEMEKSNVFQLQQQVERLSVAADTSDAVARVT